MLLLTVIRVQFLASDPVPILDLVL
jgi:hypothetical protein